MNYFLHFTSYVCGENTETCFKFVNNETGQEFVYIDGEVSYDVAVLGTYNYGGSANWAHVLDDMSPYWDGGNTVNDPTWYIDRVWPKLDVIDVFPNGQEVGVDAPTLPMNPIQEGSK